MNFGFFVKIKNFEKIRNGEYDDNLEVLEKKSLAENDKRLSKAQRQDYVNKKLTQKIPIRRENE